jgi:hypothetical protein
MFYIVRQSDRDIHSDNMMCMDGHEWILMPSFPGDTLLVKYETSNDKILLKEMRRSRRLKRQGGCRLLNIVRETQKEMIKNGKMIPVV